MKKLFCMLLLLFLLAACGAEAGTPDKTETPEDIRFFSPIKTVKLDGGKTLAVQEGFTVKYLSAEYELLEEVELFAKSFCGIPSDCVFSNDRIFMGRKTESGTGTAVCLIEGEWKFLGGTFFDRKGNIIRELPFIQTIFAEKEGAKAEASTGEIFDIRKNCERIRQLRWIGEDVVMLICEEHIFVYRISEDKLYLSTEVVPFSENENSFANIKAPLFGGADFVFKVIEKTLPKA